MIRTDCRYFPLDRPCSLQKEKNIHCPTCTHYLPSTSSTKQKNILIIKLGAKGDVLRTTFLLPGIKEKFPAAKVHWVVALGSEDVLRGNPYLTRVIPFDENVYEVLSAEYFDVVINLDLSPASLSLATLALSDDKVGYWFGKNRIIKCSNAAAQEWLEMSAYDEKKKSNTFTYQHWMSKIVGLPRDDYEIYTPLRRDSLRKAATLKKRFRLHGHKVIGINPGAGKRWPKKKWTIRGYREIMKRLLKEGSKILLLGGPEEERTLASLAKGFPRSMVINTGTRNSLGDFFALINLCDLVITGDTLAMHAALGLKKKVVAIFGPTSAPEIELYGRGKKVVSPAPCVCCYRPICSVRPDCMQTIYPDAVWEAVEGFL